jgi:hypothetical protein
MTSVLVTLSLSFSAVHHFRDIPSHYFVHIVLCASPFHSFMFEKESYLQYHSFSLFLFHIQYIKKLSDTPSYLSYKRNFVMNEKYFLDFERSCEVNQSWRQRKWSPKSIFYHFFVYSANDRYSYDGTVCTDEQIRRPCGVQIITLIEKLRQRY